MTSRAPNGQRRWTWLLIALFSARKCIRMNLTRILIAREPWRPRQSRDVRLSHHQRHWVATAVAAVASKTSQ